MALCAFSDRFALYDITPVENVFLLEFMPYAPGDYVRVYLYGLMQCRHPDADGTLDGMARVLNMKSEEVLKAFKYWEQKGLVIGLSDKEPSFRFVNVRSAMLSEKQDDRSDAYQYRDFNNKLQAMLGLLHPAQFQKAMEWVEDLELSPEVVLEMVRGKNEQLTAGGTKKRSIPYLFKAFDETALDFANRNIRTIEQVKKELMRGTPHFKLASSVLDYLNMRRNPTTAELELAEKWRTEWKLSDGAVLGALKQTAASSHPSFAYLDKILERHSAASDTAEEKIEQDKQLFEAVKKLLTELGLPNRIPSEDQRKAYARWIDEGFEPDVLVRAAVRCNRSNHRSFDQLEQVLLKWKQLGVTTSAAAEEYSLRQGELRNQCARLLERAGIDRKPTDADIEQLKDWLKHAPFELVMYAAECAHGLKLPTRSMAKNLGEWAGKGICDVESAKRERASRLGNRQNTGKSAEQKKLPAQNYEQRDYDKNFFDNFFANLGDGEGEGK